METRAVLLAWETGSVEYFFGVGGVEGVLCDVWFIGPMIGRKYAARDARFAVKQIANKRFAVGSESESLANFALGEDGIFEIKAKITKICAGPLRDGHSGLACEHGDQVRQKRAHFQVSGAFSQFERAHDCVRNDAKTDARDLRRAAKVIWIAFDDHFFGLRLRNEAKRA